MRRSSWKRGNMEKASVRTCVMAFGLVVLTAGTALSQTEAKKNVRLGKFLEKDSIVTYIVRDQEKDEINLTMLIAHNSALDARIQKLSGQKLLPIVFSVSTVPHHSYYFNPLALVFEQGGKKWRLDSLTVGSQIIQLEADGKFGGMVHPGEIHQAVILLPEWFRIDEPIYVQYDESVISSLKLTELR